MTKKIAVIGLGYVGLPLAHAFSFKYKVTGFDIFSQRVQELKGAFDKTKELSGADLKAAIANGIVFTDNAGDIKDCNVFIVTVPTPVDKSNIPDLSPLIGASKTVGGALKKGDIVIYESTVYPGATEEVCVPVLENVSGLKFNRDFFCGYSPERINPGDKQHTVTKIVKITSGSNEQTAKEVDELYKSIITAGTHRASSIKVAEAAKVIENSQRDINIAFINELAKIFEKMGIDTNEVLAAAGTKWNFLNFKPGLVGGHCIGVDPYYLTHKAQSLGYHPQIILSGRRINDSMGAYIASRVIKGMIKQGIDVKTSKVLTLGITFKENCPDIRNSKVIDIINELKDYGVQVFVSDPWANKDETKKVYGVELETNPDISAYDALIFAVAHREFAALKPDKRKQFVFDVKNIVADPSDRL
ncbi:MAG: nucleotide sugar dehydrogenase [Helicobacteraceae bacterium]